VRLHACRKGMTTGPAAGRAGARRYGASRPASPQV
jgi:hypothetical protein